MPISPPKPCTQCGVLVRDGGSRCEAHRQVWVKAKPTKRITGRKLQRMRDALFKRNPLCVLCEAKGIFTPATQRDHIKALAEGGLDDESNEQGLCDGCHREKSLAEAVRGRWGRGGAKV